MTNGEHPIPSADESAVRPPSKLGDHPALTVVTLVLSILGTATGAMALLSQERVRFFATAGYGTAQRPWSLQVGLVNTSTRGISIVEGHLVVEDLVVARLSRAMPAVPSVNDPRHDIEVFAEAQPPPVALGPGQSIAGTFIFDWIDSEGADRDPARELFNSLLVPPVHFDWRQATPLLRLNLKPGGWKAVHVSPPPASVSPVEFLDPDTAPGWHVLVETDSDGVVNKIMITGPGERPAIGTLRLWRDSDGAELHKADQPILQEQGADFALSDRSPIPPGRYRWAITADGETVSVGVFL